MGTTKTQFTSHYKIVVVDSLSAVAAAGVIRE